MSFAFPDIVIEFVGMSGRVEDIALEVLKVDFSGHIVEDIPEPF